MKGKMMKNLDEKEWGVIQITDIFDTVCRGKRLKKSDHIQGDIPYVSSTSLANGTDGTCGNDEDVRIFSDCLTLANSGSVGSCFYHPYQFVASDHVTALQRKGTDPDSYLALSMLVSRLGEKYNFNREINDIRISRERVMLPVTESGKPDYEYMSEYVQIHRKAMLAKYRAYVKNRIAALGEYVEIPALSEKEWKAIPIVKIFERFDPGKGHGLNHLAQVPLGINYIGATNRNNGVLCSVARTKETSGLIQEGNCIGFIKNGDGSAGFAIYKRERFISTNDVIYGYASWLNPSTGLFFVAAQDMIEKKYCHGYKRNQQHLRGDKVMLPVTDLGEPDYGYMEQYAKNMMIRKYRQYLSFLNAKDKTETVQGR